MSISDEAFATIDDETLTADSIADFTRSVNDSESGTEFVFSLYGLVPNAENTVTITATYESGDVETTTFACNMCDVIGDEELQLVVTDGESTAELEGGLYAHLGNEHSAGNEVISFYDNDGILRGEIPLVGRSQRLIFEDGLMYFNYSYFDFTAMNGLGQVVKDYTLDEEGIRRYRIHHDYISNGDYLFILGTDNFSDTIEDLVLDQDGEFTVQGGQHSITYEEDDGLENGQYYIYVYNNIGYSQDFTSDFDYASVGLTVASTTSDEEGVYSYYYKYLVDKDAGTFSLADSFEMPYSGLFSSVQELDSNIVVDSGYIADETAEYDEDGELIRSYTVKVESVLYRVFKYDL